VFYGTLDGWFNGGRDARSGKVSGSSRWLRCRRESDDVLLVLMDKQYVADYAGIGWGLGPSHRRGRRGQSPYDVRERGRTLPDISRWTSWAVSCSIFRCELEDSY